MNILFRRLAPLSLVTLALLGAAPARAAQAFLIADAKTGHILAERDSRTKRPVASLTKIATAMVAMDWMEHHAGDLTKMTTIPPEAFVGSGENLIGLQPGDQITLRDLLYAALIQSDGIAAYTLANSIGHEIQGVVPANPGGPVATFVGQMNALAKTLNMQRTLFVNPSGQDANASPRPYSTAFDMARLTRYALNKAAFRFYVSQKERQISFTRAGKKKDYMLRNTNELLGQMGVDGVKTGRTAMAGDCLVLSAQREAEIVKLGGERARVTPRNLIVVILGSPNRFEEGRQLLAQGWALYDQWAAQGRMIDPKKVL